MADLPPKSPGFPPPPKFAPPSFPAPSGLKFPVRPAGAKPLVLPRRISPLQRAQEATQATAEARRSIGALMSQSRPPWGGKPSLSGNQVEELEKTIRTLEAKLAEREMALAAAGVSKEQEEALKKLKEELDRQEENIRQQREALKEREEFLEQSETALFEKMQSQQEKETELEQKEEDLKRLARQLGVAKEEPPEPMEKA